MDRDALMLSFDDQEISTQQSDQTVFTAVLTASVVIVTFNMGCQLDLNMIKETLKKPSGPVTGFCSQFLFMPLLSFGVAFGMFNDALYRFGIIVIGCCPGSAVSSYWTLLLDGDVSLSITMSFISISAALGMLPFWLLTLGEVVIPAEENDIKVPYVKIVTTLGMLAMSLAVGMAVKWRFPKCAHYIEHQLTKPITLFMCVAIFGVGLYFMKYSFNHMTWKIILAGFTVSCSGFTFGALAAYSFKLNLEQIIAISIETGIQNAAVGLMVIRVSLPARASAIASIPLMSQILASSVPLYFIYAALYVYRSLQTLQQEDEEAVHICHHSPDKTHH